MTQARAARHPGLSLKARQLLAQLIYGLPKVTACHREIRRDRGWNSR